MHNPIVPFEEVEARLAPCKDVFERFNILREYDEMIRNIENDYLSVVGNIKFMEQELEKAKLFKVKALLYDNMMDVFNNHPDLMDDWHALLVKAKLVDPNIEESLSWEKAVWNQK